jgi:hypothetical protein
MMLKHNELYRYARPELMAKNFTELRDKYLPAEQRAQHLRRRASARSGLACGLSASRVATYLRRTSYQPVSNGCRTKDN